jgi:hypothetical protein
MLNVYWTTGNVVRFDCEPRIDCTHFDTKIADLFPQCLRESTKSML